MVKLKGFVFHLMHFIDKFQLKGGDDCDPDGVCVVQHLLYLHVNNFYQSASSFGADIISSFHRG